MIVEQGVQTPFAVLSAWSCRLPYRTQIPGIMAVGWMLRTTFCWHSMNSLFASDIAVAMAVLTIASSGGIGALHD